MPPLATLDPTGPLDDLEPLDRLIGPDVRVVAVGESVHAAHEFYALRHRVVRFLVERLGFTAVASESGFPETFAVDDYVRGRRADRDRVLADGLSMNLGRCREMADLLDWLRGWNAAAAEPVRFYGLDLPGTDAALRPAFDFAAAYVDAVDPGFGPRLARLRELVAAFGPGPTPADPSKLVFAGSTAVRQYTALSGPDRNELTALLADLAARFDAHRRTYVERSDTARFDLARQHLRVAAALDSQLRAVAALMAGDASACDGNIRDATMADTLEWVLGRHRRVVVLAHNGHIQKTPVATPAGVAVDTLGVHLAHRLGDRHLVIGTTCGGGEMVAMRTVPVADGPPEAELYLRDLPPAPADTVDAELDAAAAGPRLIDLRTRDTGIAAGRMRMQDLFVPIDIRRAFDMLVHVPTISVWTSDTTAAMPDERTARDRAPPPPVNR